MAAYFGINSLLSDYNSEFSEGCWDLSGNAERLGEGTAEFSAGTVHVKSNITQIEGNYIFAAKKNPPKTGKSLISCGICEAVSR